MYKCASVQKLLPSKYRYGVKNAFDFFLLRELANLLLLQPVIDTQASHRSDPVPVTPERRRCQHNSEHKLRRLLLSLAVQRTVTRFSSTSGISMAAVSWQALAAQLSPVTLLTEQLHKLAWRAVPLAVSSLSSYESVLSGSSWLMGRRDKRTCKGKVFKGSSGNVSQPVDVETPQQPTLRKVRHILHACRHDQSSLSSLHYSGSGSSSEWQQHSVQYRSHTLIRKPLLRR